jgi:hypothetical protein
MNTGSKAGQLKKMAYPTSASEVVCMMWQPQKIVEIN